MFKKFLIIFIFLFISNCSVNKVVNHHGVHFLDKKQVKLILNKSNKNDIVELLGPPSTKSSFDNDVWIYMERKISTGPLIKLSKKKIVTNNVLILEIDTMGLLVSKDFLDINDMNKLKFSKNETKKNYTKDSYVYNFLSTLRRKINDPLGKRNKSK
jgi:outer membrane protein assembly factor BamE (lipoprotein component of BamABCDE complex)